MKGRPLVAALAISVVLPLFGAHAQPARIPRIGYLSLGRPGPSPLIAAFEQGLRDHGYVRGQNLVIEYRLAETAAQSPTLAAELVRLNVDAIVAVGSVDIGAAQRATATIPIVMVMSSDPVGLGHVESLARPGRNITGLSKLSPEVRSKSLELLKEAAPKTSRVAIFWDMAAAQLQLKMWQEAGKALRVQLHPVELRTASDLERAFQAITRLGAQALVVGQVTPLFIDHRSRIADLAVKSRLPSIAEFREFAEAGGLLAYGPSLPDLWRRAAGYVDRILKGARPADLPVEQPTKFELVVNLKTAKTLGLTIPQSLLVRADDVIQ